METDHPQHWLPNFRRALRYLAPHRRVLIMGLISALGVSVFYTFSISSIVPVLKVMFAEHETLVDWLHRAVASGRLGVVVPADLPDDPAGLDIDYVRSRAPVEGVLRAGDRIVAVAGKPGSAYGLARLLARHPGEEVPIRVVRADGTEEEVVLAARAPAAWWPAAAWVAERLPNDRSAEGRLRMLFALMTAIVVIALLGAICRFCNEGFVALAVQRTMHDLRTSLADHTLRLPLTWHSRQPAGDTLSRFATDLNKVEVGVSTLFGKVAREPLKAIGVLVLALAFDWRMLVAALVGLPIGYFVIRLFGRMVKRAQRRVSQSWGRLLDHLDERLAGIRVVKASNMEAAESRRFATEGRELQRAQTHIELVDAASNPVLELLASLAISAFVLYGGSRVFQGELEPQLLFGAVICLGGVFDPLRKMGNVNNRLQAAEAAARRLFELLDLPMEEHANEADRPALPRLTEAIEFRDVTFAYPSNPGQPVLEGINLRIEKGTVVALVGGNGSGKTTLMSLLLRFFEPTKGTILIDGRDIRAHNLTSLRSQIGLVTQEAIIFSDSVRANIAYGANGIGPDAVEQAARRAFADEFVRALHVEADGVLTTGYDALVNGRTLSGGQRQRIALARAILRDPPILILDEATSQIDTESEQRIQAALEDVTRDRTTFIIAHRFSTIARAQLIVVLEQGRLVGCGAHEELLQSCPAYEVLVRTQFAGAR
ncbi:MAG: ATP-binding cassette domain-containing protein [Phycisphaerales bacterium]|nr:ATP-binding cassette domain-containing protein [Phycisphaerales bacterium]